MQKVPTLRFELRMLDSKSRVLTTTPQRIPHSFASTVNRTQGLQIFSLTLSQLSYRGYFSCYIPKKSTYNKYKFCKIVCCAVLLADALLCVVCRLFVSSLRVVSAGTSTYYLYVLLINTSSPSLSLAFLRYNTILLATVVRVVKTCIEQHNDLRTVVHWKKRVPVQGLEPWYPA